MNFMDAHQLVMFIAAGWLLNLTPGPDVLYIVTNALKSGTRAGIVAGLGITAGCFVHIFAAAVGVGALLATSATAFTVLKWVGAAYLVWMGGRMLFANAAADGGGRQERTTSDFTHNDYSLNFTFRGHRLPRESVLTSGFSCPALHS